MNVNKILLKKINEQHRAWRSYIALPRSMDPVCITGLSHYCKTSTSPHSARNRLHGTSVVLCGHRVAGVLFSFRLLPHPAPAHAVWSEPEWGHSHLGNTETNNRLIIGSF